MSEDSWDVVVDVEKGGSKSTLRSIWDYRDLLWLLVRRDFVAFYKQTVLGPFWFFISPIASSLVYMFVFGNLAGFSNDGIPSILFYLSGVTIWGYFSGSMTQVSNSLNSNANIFRKVYFPRLIIPLSIVCSNLMKVGIQLIIIFSLIVYYVFFTNSLDLRLSLLLFPFIILIVAMQALGLGLLVTSLSIKYRDVSMFMGYLISLGLYITPVVYPLSSAKGLSNLLLKLNPMTFPIESFRYLLFGIGTFSSLGIIYMITVSILILLIGTIAFNKAEKTFVDLV